MSTQTFNKKHMTSWQEEKHTEQEVSAFIKKSERHWSGKYHSHTMEEHFNPTLGHNVWLLGVTIIKK